MQHWIRDISSKLPREKLNKEVFEARTSNNFQA